MIYRSTHRPAFTLLEVLVSLSIIVVILTLSTVNYKRSNSRNAIIFGSYQLAADIRLAESYAASARQYSTDPSWNVWGVNFTTGANQYRIFVDRNFNGFYDGELPSPANILVGSSPCLFNSNTPAVYGNSPGIFSCNCHLRISPQSL
jgi:prepilin-type N-terminal cleavage/methylation domain-containing protein